jgi:hypothetical protein
MFRVGICTFCKELHMKRDALIAVIVIIAGGFSVPVFAQQAPATLVSLKGSVMLNQGKQFVTAPAGSSLVAGDRVLALDGATATIKYSDGCVTVVEPRTVVTIPKLSPCKGGIASVAKADPQQLGALGDASVDSGGGWILPTALIAGGVVGTVLIVNNQRNHRTASP